MTPKVVFLLLLSSVFGASYDRFHSASMSDEEIYQRRFTRGDPATSGSAWLLTGYPKLAEVSALSYSEDGGLKISDARILLFSGRKNKNVISYHNNNTNYILDPLPNSSGLTSTATEVGRVPTLSETASKYPVPDKNPGGSISHGALYRSSSTSITSPTPQDGGPPPFKPLHMTKHTLNNEQTSSEDPASPGENGSHTSQPPPYIPPSRDKIGIAPAGDAKPFLISVAPTSEKGNLGQAETGYSGSLNEALTRIKRQLVKPPQNQPRLPPPPHSHPHPLIS